MAIEVKCPQCARRIEVPFRMAGKTVKCHRCDVVLDVPSSKTQVSVVDDFRNDFLPQFVRLGYGTVERFTERLIPQTTPPPWAYLVVFLAFFPLLAGLFSHGHDDMEARFRQSLVEQGRDTTAFDVRMVQNIDVFLDSFPGQKIHGALLSKNTSMHYVWALASTCLFVGASLFLFGRRLASALSLLMVTLFTATVGLFALDVFQYVAFVLASRPDDDLLQRLGSIYVFGSFLSDASEAGFLVVFIANTLAVGLVEEVCKLLPVLAKVGNLKALGARGALCWGFCSGVGFGVVEGIEYSENYYNGISTVSVYVIRFLASVGLHAVLCAASASMLYAKEVRQGSGERTEWWTLILSAIVVPAVLHGLFNASVGEQFYFLGFSTTVAAVIWLAYALSLAERREAHEDEDAAAPGDTLVTHLAPTGQC